MERVPWPRPTVLHAARRLANGGSAYDDRVVRARLAQAFGRLIRRQGDQGLFVILSSALPSRLLTAFPPEVDGVAACRSTRRSTRVRRRLFGEGGGEPVAQLDEALDRDAAFLAAGATGGGVTAGSGRGAASARLRRHRPWPRAASGRRGRYSLPG